MTVNLISLFFIALAMSTDAFAAAIGKGSSLHKPTLREALRTGVIFGLDESSHADPPLAATLFLGLHAVNGAAILLLGVLLVVRARRLVRQGTPTKPAVAADDAPAPVPSA